MKSAPKRRFFAVDTFNNLIFQRSDLSEMNGEKYNRIVGPGGRCIENFCSLFYDADSIIRFNNNYHGSGPTIVL